MTLKQAIQQLKQGKINSLNFSSAIKDKDIQALAQVLDSEVIFSSLSLRSSQIGALNTRVLSKGLKNNQTLVSLNLCDNQISDQGLQGLAEALKNHTTLVELNLEYNQLSAEGIQSLAEALKFNHTLTHLDLSSNEIGNKGASALAEMLKQNRTLVKLDLSFTQLGIFGLEALIDMLKYNTTLISLSLAGNQLDEKDSQKLAAALRKNKTLAYLNLRSNRLDCKGVSILAEALQYNHSLSSLSLWDNQIGDEGVQALAEALRQNKTLSVLELNRNEIENGGVKAMAKILEHTRLLTLDLRNNQIENEGISALAKALTHNNTLSFLNLWANQVSFFGVETLAEALKYNTTLCYLNLGENRVGIAGAKVLANMLKENNVLSSLNLSTNKLGDAGVETIATALKINQGLHYLYLGGNKISDSGIQALANAIKDNASLSFLDLSNNCVGSKGAQLLAQVLEDNTTLFAIDLSNNEIDDTGVEPLVAIISCNTTLALFDLRYNRMSHAGIQKLIEALSYYNNFVTLNLKVDEVIQANMSLKITWQNYQRGKNEIINAAIEGNESKLTTFFNQRQNFPSIILTLLIQHGHEGLVLRWKHQWSLAALRFKDEEGNTPLHNAILHKAEKVILWLLPKKVSLIVHNQAKALPLTLLEKLPNLTLTGEGYHKIGDHYLAGKGIKSSRRTAISYYEKANQEGYKPAIWLLELLAFLGSAPTLEAVNIEKVKLMNITFPVLIKEDINVLLNSITTPEGKLISSLTQQNYTLYHLPALLGSMAWFEIIQTMMGNSEQHLFFSPALILEKDKQGLKPSALAKHQVQAFAKGAKSNSFKVEHDTILKNYHTCQIALRDAEEKAQLNLIVTKEGKHQGTIFSYEERAQALKENIASLQWSPPGVSENLVNQYGSILQQLWSLKQNFVNLKNSAKGQLIWPEDFDPFSLSSPGQTVRMLHKAPAKGFLKFKLAWGKGDPSVYVRYYLKLLQKWLDIYIQDNKSNQLIQVMYEQGKQAFNQLINIYTEYASLLVQATNDIETKWLLSTPVLLLQAKTGLTFVTSINDESQSLSPAAKLSHFLNKGERIAGMAGAGTSPVFPIQGVHYKRNPHAPGIEFMVSSLGKVLAGEGATPTELLKVIGPDGIAYPYQASFTVRGKDLQLVLEHHLDCINKIRSDNFAAVVVLGILTDPQDGKPDNYMVEFSKNEKGEITQIDILGIDNDIAFSDVIVSKHSEGEKSGEYIMNIKNVLYFFPQMMRPIDPKFRDALLKRQPEFMLIEWLELLLAKNKEYETLLAEGVFSLAEYEGDGRISKRGLQLPIKVVSGTIARIYRKLKTLYEALIQQPNITLWNLLMAIEPEIAIHYTRIKQQYPHSSLGCDIMRCIKALYEENISNGRELMQFRAQLESGYTHAMTSLVLKTANEFGFEDNRTTSLKESIINLVKNLKYEDFTETSALKLYEVLKKLMEASDLDELLTVALAHNYGKCVYWLWQESIIKFTLIKNQCEALKKYTLLHFFVQSKYLEGVNALLVQAIYEVNVNNSQGYTPLHIAASLGDKPMAEYLVTKGAYLRAKTLLGKTPLMMAKSRCQQMNETTLRSGDEKYAEVINYLQDMEKTISHSPVKMTKRFRFLPASHSSPSLRCNPANPRLNLN